jgi:hypothetical protein
MKQIYDTTVDDKKFLETQLIKSKKLNKILYLQNLNKSSGKSKLGIDSMIKKEDIDMSIKSSSDKLMISEERKSASSNHIQKVPLTARKSVNSLFPGQNDQISLHASHNFRRRSVEALSSPSAMPIYTMKVSKEKMKNNNNMRNYKIPKIDQESQSSSNGNN